MRALRAWVPLLIALIMAACAAPLADQTESADDELGATSAALVNQCNSADLDDRVTWSSSYARTEACEGNWNFRTYNRCTLTDSRCGTYCPQWRTCRDWSFGRDLNADQMIDRTQGMTQIPRTCTERCVRRVFGICVDHETTCVVNSSWATTRCAEWAENFRSFYYNHGNYVGSRVAWSYMSNYTANSNNTYNGTCNYRLAVPQPRNEAGAVCDCAQAYAPRTCELYDPRCGENRVPTALNKTKEEAIGILYSTTGAAPFDEIEGIDVAELRCTSCESYQLPASAVEAGADIKVQNKYTCLNDRRALATSEGALRTDRNKIIMYERWGALLTQAQRENARPLYSNLPSLPDVNSCGNDTELPAVTFPSSCPPPAAGQLMGHLRRCQRLTGEHTDVKLQSLELTSCTAALELLAATPTCAHSPYAAFQAKSVAKLLVAQFGLLGDEPTGLGALVRQLGLIDAWYRTATAAGARPSSAELERVLTEFRLALAEHNQSFDVLNGALGDNAAEIQAALGTAEQHARAMDQNLLNVLFTPVGGGLPLTGVPLAHVAGDALSSLLKRLDDMASYHDFGCSFRQCDTGSINTPVLQGFRVLAALDDATDLSAALSASNLTLSGYTAIFQKIHTNHAPVAAVLADEHAQDSSLVRHVATAKARFGNFQLEGRFRGMKSDLLHAGLTASEREAVIAAVRQSVNHLGATVADYDHTLESLFGAVMGELAAGSDATRVSGEIAVLAKQVDDLGKDLAGLQQNAAANEKKFSRAMMEHQIKDQMSPNAFFQLGESTRVDLDGTSGKYNFLADPNHTGPVSALAAATIPNLGQGQMLMIEAHGQYAPTCAIRRLSGNILPPQGSSGVPVNVAGSLTGPEGFTVSFQNGSYNAESTTNSETTTAGVRAEVCTGGSAPGFSASACAYAGHEWSWSESESQGEETRTSASFMSGLRLKNTPFPKQAAGALLVVFANPTTGAIIDVRAVHSTQTAVFVPAAATAYLVVNDERDPSRCTGADTAHKLSVTATPMVSGPNAAAQLAQGMSLVLADLRAQQDAYIAQGRILSEELNQLRSSAINALTGTLDVEALPASLREIFEEFMAAELANLQRRVEILSVERQRELLLIQIRTLHKVLVNANANLHLAKQLPQRLLRRLSASILEHDVTNLQVVVEEYLEPVLELWYPRVYELTASSPRIAMLLSLGLDSELEDAADAVHDLVNEVLNTLAVAQLGYKGQGSTLPIVAVSFVKPGTPVVNPVTGQRQVSNLRKVDDGRAQDLWDAIEGRTTAHIQLRPEDIYGFGANRTDFTLSCAEHVPVVYKMAGYFSGSAEDVDGELNQLSRTFDAYPASGQLYADESGLLPYQLVNDVWTRMDMPILYGTFTNISSVFNTDHDVTSQRPVGLSPFAQYDLDFSAFDAIEGSGGLTGEEGKFEFIVLLQVDSRPAGSNLPWVDTCH
jgi:hypothetical protein